MRLAEPLAGGEGLVLCLGLFCGVEGRGSGWGWSLDFWLRCCVCVWGRWMGQGGVVGGVGAGSVHSVEKSISQPHA